jgi:hypothetical protein
VKWFQAHWHTGVQLPPSAEQRCAHMVRSRFSLPTVASCCPARLWPQRIPIARYQTNEHQTFPTTPSIAVGFMFLTLTNRTASKESSCRAEPEIG